MTNSLDDDDSPIEYPPTLPQTQPVKGPAFPVQEQDIACSCLICLIQLEHPISHARFKPWSSHINTTQVKYDMDGLTHVEMKSKSLSSHPSICDE